MAETTLCPRASDGAYIAPRAYRYVRTTDRDSPERRRKAAAKQRLRRALARARITHKDAALLLAELIGEAPNGRP